MSTEREVHWERTRRLMFITLTIWFIFSFVVHWFADGLNSMSFMGFPLGYYMAAQGSLAVFVVLIFWFSWAQNKIDHDCGVAEDQ
jgi:putative solute:sodium symporter small subunit